MAVTPARVARLASASHPWASACTPGQVPVASQKVLGCFTPVHPRLGAFPASPGRAGAARAHLGDARVGALDVVAGPVEPGGAAVGPEGALGLAAAPATLELGVGLEAQPAALALRRALVQVNCGDTAGTRRGAQPGEISQGSSARGALGC